MVHPDNLIHPDLSKIGEDDRDGPVIAWAGEQEKGIEYGLHSHWRAQLFHIVSGSVTVETERGNFVVPPERAVWIPPEVLHGVRYHQRSVLRYLFFRPEAVRHLAPQPSVILISPLVRELVVALLGYPRGETATDGAAGRIAEVILDHLATEPIAPLHLPMPSSPRLRRAVSELAADPAREDRLADLARRAALSTRSFERHFRLETGLSLRAWRRQARLMKAVEWLSLGASVGEVADRLGYEEPSAFVAGFRKAFGVTPGRYFGDAGV
jgi:AraC-like DNA-binding protein